MALEKVDLRKELTNYRYDYKLLQRIDCSKEENKKYAKMMKAGEKLPDGVYPYTFDGGITSTTDFYTIYDPGFSDAEKMEYLMYQKLEMIKFIKGCASFYLITTLISLFILLVYWLGNS